MLLRRFAIVVSQQPAKSFATDDVAIATTNFVVTFNELVAQPLMIPLSVIMRQVLANGISKRLFAAEDQLFQALGFE